MRTVRGGTVRFLAPVLALGFGLCLAQYGTDSAAFFRGYLPACLFWAGIPLGSLALLMVHQLTGGAWGWHVRPDLQAAAATIPLLALLFLPAFAGLADLYPWAAPDPKLAEVATRKSAYLNTTAFAVRAFIVFLIWTGLAAGLGTWRGDATSDTRNRSAWSAAGLILYGLTATLFGIDWIMSLEPRWSSTNFGFLMMVSPMVAALAFAIVAVCASPQRQAERDVAPRLNDLGNLLLAGVLLWAYLEFQQYLAIWYENLPDKIGWYLHRNRNGWEWVSAVMASCYAALPFLLLLSRRLKRSRKAMAAVAGLVLLGNLVNTYWLTLPAHYPRPGGLTWLGIGPFLAVGGLWLAAFLWLRERRAATGGSQP